MATKNITYNFFQITPKRNNTILPKDIQACLFEILNCDPSTTFKPLKSNGKTYFMYKFEKQGTYFTGTIVCASSDNISGKVNLDTLDIERLNIGEAEGLEKHSTFLLDPQNNILVLEKGGITSLQLCNYLSYCSKLPKCDVALIINPSEIQKFYKMHRITKFSVRVAQIESGSIFSNNKEQPLPIDQVIESADGTNADELHYEIKTSSRKTQKNSLDKSKIANFIKSFLGFKETEEVTELKVTGEYLDEEGSNRIVPLDLIKERLYDVFQIETDRHSSIFHIENKYQGLLRIYAKHRQSLLNVYKINI